MKSSTHYPFCKAGLTLLVGSSLTLPVAAQTGQIDEIAVIGTRGALQNAIEKQRNADKVVGVVDSDALGNFSDINVSESLRRIAGIMVENDQGEGRYVSVRGMNTDLNAMTINGVSTASPEDRRGIMLDGVPTDILSSMTVYKTLTPNLDADTIGGAIDLETISAFSYDERNIRIKAETSHNELTGDSSNPVLSATYTDRFAMADGELGVAVVLSDQTRHILAQNNEAGGWGDVAPNDDYEMRYYDLEREREGLVLNLDYRTAGGQMFYAHMFRNEYLDTEYRGKWETRDTLEDNEPTINGSTFTYATSRFDTEARWRPEKREINAAQIGTQWQLDNGSNITFEIFGSRAEQDDTEKYAAIYRSDELDIPLTYDNSNSRQPVLSYPNEFLDPGIFGLKVFEHEIALTTDRDVGAKFDMTWAFNADTEIQYGAKYRQREKRNNFNFCGYEPIDDYPLTDANSTIIGPYLASVHGPAPTTAHVRSLVGQRGTGFTSLSDGTTCPSSGALFEFSGDEEEESIAADWATDEDILSLYAMGTTITGKATWVYGVRYEDTSATYAGKNWNEDLLYTGAVSYDNDYDFWAPSLNVKFDISDTQVARFGAFRSLVRPGFQQSAAGAIINLDDMEIEGGNPELNPTVAWNFDLTYEFYLGNETFLGAGVFYKDIQDSIVEVERQDAVLRGQTWTEAGTFVNADDSSIMGFELSFQTAWENGMLFVVNYTHTDGETDLPADAANGQRTIPYFKQAENTANVVLGFDKNAWDIRLAANYRDDYLDEVGDDALTDRYTGDHMQVDLTVKYQLNDNLLINAAALNLNDRPEYYYFGNGARLSQYDEYGSTFILGMRYQF